ncbi:transcriptional enhancer factor TEF-3 isoform X4 [Tursiops truncatus]|uniref:Transcriptional enhancer factor TEF-3 isoform X2 n=1 Tax=Tursiops truncatus TaxID=9739 RepID=A0A6J3S8A7_TURTR|nr:transcriptional enhancer factor TEF-3 isoform X2 [Tursiops truncatus]
MCARSSCVLGPGAGSPVGTAGKGAAARAPDVRPRPSFWGRRGERGVLAAGREARGRPAGQEEGFRPRPRAGGWPGPAGSWARGGGRESGPRSKGKHVCGAAAEAGAGRRGRSLVPAAAPRRRRPPRARGPSPRPSLLPEGSGPGRHSLQLPPSAARISFQPSFLTFQASSFQTPGRGRGGPAAPGSAVRPRPPGPTGAPPSGALEGTAGTITSNEWSSPNSPEGSNVSGGSQALDKPIDNDAEGVWSPDIEQSFQEALAIYPPCGRRKIILSDEGKMYGRNELIARYIKLRTGKTRTRKQVSSHIQVLARRKAREIQAKLKFWQGALPGHAGTSHDVKPFSQQTYTVQPSLPLPGFEAPAGASPSPSAPPAPPWQGRSVASPKLWMLEFSAFLERQQDPETYNKHLFVHIGQSSPSYSDPYLEAVDIRQIYDKFPERKGGLKELFERGPSNAFFLVKFWHQLTCSTCSPKSHTLHESRDNTAASLGAPCPGHAGPGRINGQRSDWKDQADLNTNIEDEGSSFYGVSSQYESPENMTITCSTKVCSFGKQVVEKLETEYARYENGHYSYRIHRSPLCEYMINFIHKLKHLPEKYMMNSVLENFTILQVVTNRDTQETLLCVAYVFEVSASEHGAQHHIYRLVKE